MSRRPKRRTSSSPIVPVAKAVTGAMKVDPKKLATPKGFKYTAAPVLQARGFMPPPPPKREGMSEAEYAKARAAYDAARKAYKEAVRGANCMLPRKVKKTKTGERVTFGKPTGERCAGTISWDDKGNPKCSGETFRDPKCQPSRALPCGTGRFAKKDVCPVQLTWLEGKPVLRLCENQGQPGRLVRVKGPKDAFETARKLCEQWARGRTWEALEVPAVRVPKERDAGLGGKRKTKKRKTKKRSK